MERKKIRRRVMFWRRNARSKFWICYWECYCILVMAHHPWLIYIRLIWAFCPCYWTAQTWLEWSKSIDQLDLWLKFMSMWTSSKRPWNSSRMSPVSENAVEGDSSRNLLDEPVIVYRVVIIMLRGIIFTWNDWLVDVCPRLVALVRLLSFLCLLNSFW